MTDASDARGTAKAARYRDVLRRLEALRIETDGRFADLVHRQRDLLREAVARRDARLMERVRKEMFGDQEPDRSV